MLTVGGRLDSGTSSTRSRCARRYSVMPSIEAASVTPAGGTGGAALEGQEGGEQQRAQWRGSFDRDRRMANHSWSWQNPLECIRCDRFRLFRAAHPRNPACPCLWKSKRRACCCGNGAPQAVPGRAPKESACPCLWNRNAALAAAAMARRRPPAFLAELNADPQVTEFLVPLDAAQSDALADRLAAEIDEHGWGVWRSKRQAWRRLLVSSASGRCRPHCLSRQASRSPGGWRALLGAWLCGRGRAGRAEGGLRAGAPEIVAFTVVENRRSRAVMAKLGMREDPVRSGIPPWPRTIRSAYVLYRLLQQDGARRPDRDGDGDRCTPVAAA